MEEQLPDEDLRTTRSFYDRISGAYDLLADASEHDARKLGLALLAAAPGERVLEIGFGTGHVLEDLARAVGPDGSVCGVDISDGMMRVAARRLEKAGLAKRVLLKVSPVPPVPYEDGAFDAVFMSFTLELFPEEIAPAVLAEVRRVLAPGGRLAVVAMHRPPGERRGSLIERTYHWMHRHFPHIVDCRPIDAGGLLAAAGFVVERTERLAIWTMPVIAALAAPA